MPLPRTSTRLTRNNTQPTKPPPTDDADHLQSGSNIRVIVRCRGRNDREVKAKSVVVVEVTGEQDVAVRTGPPDQPVVKSFRVDRVFGSEVDQNMLFDQVALPIVDDLIGGMNCTIFAYGQTGTGKTYTMSGDCAHNGETCALEAGVIPRVIFKLFSELSTRELDYTVSCSFLELYNEELKDLLSNDDTKKLRLFEDPAKKAMTLQGLTEHAITSAVSGMKSLQQGLQARQVGSTKMNDYSSRSHTIFTLHVAVDRNGSILRSKINLVDLAGSENIGKSGATDKRAKEAGMINQSLLTLGRVINSLVDKSSHVPYRESKLTRLLQDSLGGRTKTCIIATISPALINVEETLSTLEYATRAKNIKNRPQTVNPISKNLFLKDCGEKMERLQLDLVATRKKNGIYLDEEHYNELIAERESLRIQVNDQQRRLETVDSQLKDTRQQREQLNVALQQKTQDLQGTTKSLNEALNTLVTTQTTLRATSESLQKEVSLRKAHAGTESELHSIGSDLISHLDHSLADIDLLHERLERKTELGTKVRGLVAQSSQTLLAGLQGLNAKIDNINSQHGQFTEALTFKVTDLLMSESQRLKDTLQYLNDGLANLDVLNDQLVSSTGKSNTNLNGVFAGVTEIKENLKVKVSENLKDLQSFISDMEIAIGREIEKFQGDIIESFQTLVREMQETWRQQKDLAASLETRIADMKMQLDNATEEKVRLQNQLDRLHTETVERIQGATGEKKAIVAKMIQLLTDYTESQITGPMDSTVSELAAIRRSVSVLFGTTHPSNFQDILEGYRAYGQSVEDTNQNLDAKLGCILDSAQANGSSIGRVAEQFKSNAERILESSMDSNVEALEDTLVQVNKKRMEHDQLVKLGVEKLYKEIKHTFSYTEKHLQKVQSSFEQWNVSQILDEANGTLSHDSEEVRAKLEYISSVVAALKQADEEYAKHDSPIPAKRVVEYSRVLPQTRRDSGGDRLPLIELGKAENLPTQDQSSPLKRPQENMERPAKVLRAKRRFL